MWEVLKTTPQEELVDITPSTAAPVFKMFIAAQMESAARKGNLDIRMVELDTPIVLEARVIQSFFMLCLTLGIRIGRRYAELEKGA